MVVVVVMEGVGWWEGYVLKQAFKKKNLAPSSTCSCGLEDYDEISEHNILQNCSILKNLPNSNFSVYQTI
jgi:hypothetical protein